MIVSANWVLRETEIENQNLLATIALPGQHIHSTPHRIKKPYCNLNSVASIISHPSTVLQIGAGTAPLERIYYMRQYARTLQRFPLRFEIGEDRGAANAQLVETVEFKDETACVIHHRHAA